MSSPPPVDAAPGLDLILRAAGPPASVLDIAGAATDLVDRLLSHGYRDITVVDPSQDALSAAYDRVGDAPVTWLRSDILRWLPDRTFDVWHDGAAYRDLTDPEELRAYWSLARTAVPIGGHVVLAVRSTDAAAIRRLGFAQIESRSADAGGDDWLLVRRLPD